MAMADQIVTLQAQALELIPLKYRAKASVIYQSMPALNRQCPPKNSFLVSIIGHLRPEKDPFCIVRALPSIPAQSRLRVVHIGQAMDQDMAKSSEVITRALCSKLIRIKSSANICWKKVDGLSRFR